MGRDETVAYFRSRPHGSQLGAWASEQSRPVGSREELERRYAELAARYPVIGHVRGEGLLIGVEFVKDRATLERFPADAAFGLKVREAARRRGLLLRASHWMVAFAPPLTTTAAEVDEIIDLFEAALAETLAAG